MAATGAQKIWLDGEFKYGTKGSQGDTLSNNVKDVALNVSGKTTSTTSRNAKNHKMETEKVILNEVTLSFKVPNRTGDALVAALQAAVAAADMIAIYAIDSASGKGMDADFYITEMSESGDASEYSVKTSKPSDELRDPALFA